MSKLLMEDILRINFMNQLIKNNTSTSQLRHYVEEIEDKLDEIYLINRNYITKQIALKYQFGKEITNISELKAGQNIWVVIFDFEERLGDERFIRPSKNYISHSTIKNMNEESITLINNPIYKDDCISLDELELSLIYNYNRNINRENFEYIIFKFCPFINTFIKFINDEWVIQYFNKSHDIKIFAEF